MFTSSVNARVNGHVPGLAGGQETRSDQRKRKGKLLLGSNGPHLSRPHQSGTSHGPSDTPYSGLCNGQQKFSDRLVGLRGLLQSNGNEAHQNNAEHSGLNDLEDPYTFNEPDPVRRYSSPVGSSKAISKTTSRNSGKGKVVKGSSCSTEPKGLNMTRLYPALFDPNSPSTPISNSSSKTTLASLLESSISDNLHPKRSDLERSFSSFSAKDLNCFPNLTSPPPPEQPSPPPTSSIKVSPVKHGMPTTPQRESNKLAALFSPTYLNSIRHDKAKIRRISTPKNRDKINARIPSSEKRVGKDVTIKSAVVPTQDCRRQEDASKTTLSRLQDKIARKMVVGKQQRKMATKASGEVPPRRHSVNDLPLKKERSLLEEQLLGFKPSKPSKRDDVNIGVGYPSGLTPPPAATTRVPGVNGPLTYGIAKSIPSTQRSNGMMPRREKPHATYGNQKSSKNQMSTPVLYGPGKNNSLMKHSANGSTLSVPRTLGKIEVHKMHKRPRTKLDLAGDFFKHDTLQQLQKNESKSDVFTRTKVLETDSEDSDMEEGLVYQKHWFSGWMEAGSGLASEDKREGRLLQIRNEFRRKLSQVWGARRDPNASPLPKCLIEAALTKPSHTALILSPNQPWHRMGRSKLSMLVPKQCVFGKHGEGEICSSPALPCAHHCVRHITYNVEQLLFEHCTAKYPDNTQCCVPVFDSSHELPLCSEHARKADDYNKLSQVLKPKRVRKKSKPSAMTRSTKRNKKKKSKLPSSRQPSPVATLSPSVSEILPPVQAQPRIQRSQSLPVDSLSRRESEDCIDTGICLESATSPEDSPDILVSDEAFAGLSETPINVQELNGMAETIVDVNQVDVGEEEVLELAELPELTDTGDLGQQDGSLLEEHDLTNVLNEIPTIAFTDFFEDKNGEPTREETEELDRALAAVDKSLQNMGSQILLSEDLLQTTQTQAQTQVFLEVDKLSPGSQGLLDIDKLQAQVLFDEKNTQGLLDNFLDDQTLVQTLSAQLPTDLPGSSSGLVYYHNGYTVNSGGMDKNPCASTGSSSSLYQTPGIVGVPLPTQTDLHS